MAVDPFTALLSPTGVGFTGSPLDRADLIRRDDEALERVRRSEAARFLAFTELRPIVSMSDGVPTSRATEPDGTTSYATTSDGKMSLLWLTAAEIPDDAPWIFLGLDEGQPRFAVGVSAGAIGRGEPIEVRAAAAHLSDGEAAILAQARSLFAWHDRHRHCAVCGAPTRVAKGGYMRQCQSETCRAEHFPRTDPVVIMLVIDREGDRCLLGRHARFAPRVYSTLAGFVEPAETIEEAVAREVWEEVGVRVGRVRYVASQPWPFPSSLMIGCFAEALTHDLRVDSSELEDATWFTRADLRAAIAGAGPFVCPPRFTIARTLLQTWVALDAPLA